MEKEEKERLIINSLLDLDNYLSECDNSVNHTYVSHIPQVCKDFPCVLGVDEAGRGPVLGPMVYGIAFCPINRGGLLLDLECDDSKALTEKKREEIYEKICGLKKDMGYAVEVISPNFISSNMLKRSKYSLNQISMDSAIGLIKAAIDAGVNIKHIYVDTVGKPEKYQAYLKSIFPDYDITVAKKADSTYPIVSAASICAKVTRDHALQVWDFREEIEATHTDFGSGYPGDPVTKAFLKHYCDPVFGYPSLVRFSWSTAEQALKQEAYAVDWEEIEEEATGSKTKKAVSQNTSITQFFQASTPPKNEIKKARHPFFKQRGLERTKFL